MKSVITLTLVACATLYAADSKNVDRTLPLSPNGAVTIDSHNGSIRVHTWDRPQIEIHARIEMGQSWGLWDTADRRRFEETKVDIDTFGDTVRIKSNYPTWEEWFGSNPEIHYTINAPRTARWTIDDHNSRIEVYDLHAALHITTHNSHVTVAGHAGPLELNTHNGDARIEFASFTASSLVDMHNGDVELVLPSSSKFDLHTSSHNASIHSDFPVMTQAMTRSMGRRRNEDLEGAVNGGGPALRLTTHNGSFRIRAR